MSPSYLWRGECRCAPVSQLISLLCKHHHFVSLVPDFDNCTTIIVLDTLGSSSIYLSQSSFAAVVTL